MSNHSIDPGVVRAETLTGALIYLMTAYQRRHCARIAVMVQRHLQAMAQHPDVDPEVRQVCDGLWRQWALAAQPEPARPAAEHARVH